MEENELVILICFIGGMVLLFANSEEALDTSPIPIQHARVKIGKFKLIDESIDSFMFSCGEFFYVVPKCSSVIITNTKENE